MTPEKIRSRAGRKLSLVLRHDPGAIGLKLDRQGYAGVAELLQCLAKYRLPITREDLDHIVATNNKQRFSYDDTGAKIRANQGHSIDVDLGFRPVEPPAELYHGTARRFTDSIFRTGLESRSRQHVHLSADLETAQRVGQRHGTPVILIVDTKRMYADGHRFYRSDNGVWLTDAVPAEYLLRK